MENYKWKEVVVRGISPNLHAAFRARCCRENVTARAVVFAIMERYVVEGIKDLVPLEHHKNHLRYKEVHCNGCSPYLHTAFKQRCAEEKEEVYSMKSVILAGIERYVHFGAEGMRIPADGRTLNNGKKKENKKTTYKEKEDKFAYLKNDFCRNT